MKQHIDLKYFFIALVPIAIFAIEALIAGNLIATTPAVPATILDDSNSWLEAAGRYRFLGAAWLFCALAALVMALVIRDLILPTTRPTRIAAIIVMVGIVAFAMTPSIMFWLSEAGTTIHHRLGADLFETMFANAALPGCATPDDKWLFGQCGENPVLAMFSRVLDVINLFAGIGVGGLIVGMIFCLQFTGTGTLDDQVLELNRNLRRMRKQLYLSGLVLTFGLFFATSWMRWPMPLISADAQDTYGALVAAASLYNGIYFTLLILSFYLPVALLLDSHRRKLTDQAAKTEGLDDPEKLAKWQDLHGIKTDPVEVFKSGFALASPIIAAFAGSVPLAI